VPLTRWELGISSQNGEDGILQAIFDLIGSRSRYFIEFGAGCGVQGNCVLLADCMGWRGLMIEADKDASESLAAKYAGNRRVTTRNAVVTADNVEQIFDSAGVPRQIDLLSIDIDGNDFWVWQSITACVPRVVAIEYNANLPLDATLVMPRDDAHAWDGTDYFGGSLGAYEALASEKNYRLVHTDSTGVNAFFVLRSEASTLPPPEAVPRHRPNYLGTGVCLPRDPARRPFRDIRSGELVDAPRESAPVLG
jgi:hypothetical protein